MIEPLSGDMNSRITFEFRKSVPNTKSGFDEVTTNTFTVWGRIEPVGFQVFWGSAQIEQTVTHRIFVRAIPGKTYPQDLTKLVKVSSEGLKYRVRRVQDVNSAHRFTLLEVQAEGVTL